MGSATLLAVVLMLVPGAHPAVAGGVSPAEPIQWDDVVASHARVHDYTCLYEKEERAISGGERQTMRLSFRKPLDVRLEWLDDKGDVDQIAVYRQGFNGGKLTAKRRGVLGSLAGTVRLDPRDKRALADSRHPITEVGLGHIIDIVTQALRDGGLTSGPAVEEALDGHEVCRFDFNGPRTAQVFDVVGASRAVVWVDRAMRLPVRVEILDSGGSIIERHRFSGLSLNVGLTDATFAH